jgi:hypothetical protein
LIIAFNPGYGRFEAQFSTDFNGDLAAVKAAKFKCDGPPSWLWWTVKLSALNKLRENRPASGLQITDLAFVEFTRRTEMEAQNEAIREQFAPVKAEQVKAKKARRKQQVEDQTYVTLKIPSKPDQLFDYLGMEDLPYQTPLKNSFVPPVHPGPWCASCQDPVYPYETIGPIPICFWCEISVDKTGNSVYNVT